MYLNEIRYEDVHKISQIYFSVQWQVFMNTEMNLLVPQISYIS
jgi:hypothetical protein